MNTRDELLLGLTCIDGGVGRVRRRGSLIQASDLPAWIAISFV